MPFDPALPAPSSPLQSAVMRSQFNGLKELIDSVPQITGAEVAAVNTLPPGSSAAVGLELSGTVLRFTFDLPQGAEGAAGSNGSSGSDGAPGAQGPPGPGITGANVFEVQTLPPGSQAGAGVLLNGETLSFSFALPRGDAGEVTTAQMEAAVALAVQGTSANSNTVNVLSQSAQPAYDPAQMQDVISKLDELITALRRA